ncbi:MAG TPA: molybdenum cofactor biosynthesis protein MoaE [Thermoproteota archaeon]|nr:molybdenum cofactor biosynthesis protein MoaE [Thermoproteota archaeon]
MTKEDFSVEQLMQKMKAPESGAIVSFLGTVKGMIGDSSVDSLTVESYEDMALKRMLELKDEAMKRFNVADITIVHRVGTLKPTDNIVFVAVSSPHRQQAFEACRWIIDELKKSVPLWKKEHTQAGDRWVKEEH